MTGRKFTYTRTVPARRLTGRTRLCYGAAAAVLLLAVYLLGDVIFASLLGLLYFRESVAPPTLVGGSLILAGTYLGIRAGTP